MNTKQQNNKTYIVYKHTSPSNKVYIGITSKDVRQRWCNGFGYQTQLYFFRAIVKYGWINFKHEILFDGLTEEEACAIEVELIAKYKSNDARYGYNKDNGGFTGCKISERTKAKMSDAHKGQIRDAVVDGRYQYRSVIVDNDKILYRPVFV